LTTIDLSIELLQVALSVRPMLSRAPSDKEWDAIFRFAEEQAIMGVLFGGVERLPAEQRPYIDLLMDWLGQVEYLKTQNEEQDKGCMEVCRMFGENGFGTMILKGQGIARLYKAGSNGLKGLNAVNSLNPKPSTLNLVRTSGDIDIWCWPKVGTKHKTQGAMGRVWSEVIEFPSLDERREMIYNFCRDVVKDYDPKKEGDMHTSYTRADGVTVEVHCTPHFFRSSKRDKLLQKWFEDNIKAVDLQECADFGTPTLEMNMVYLLLHVHGHYLFEGIGLRQIIDYYLLLDQLKSYNEGVRKMILQKAFAKMKEFGVDKFAGAMMWVLAEKMKLSAECMLCKPDARRGKLLWNTIIAGGNFGHNWGSIAHDDWSHPFHRIWRYLKRNGQLVWYYPEEVLWHAVRRVRE